MLSKTARALTNSNNSLAGRAIKAKYGNFLNSVNHNSPSPIWKCLRWCKDTIQQLLSIYYGTHVTMSYMQVNQEIFTKPSRESNPAIRNTSGEVKAIGSKKEAHPHRLYNPILRKNPLDLTGASSTRMLHGTIVTLAYRGFYNTRVALQHSHGSRTHKKPTRSKSRPV
ncbi:hypothetical protein CRG98_032737 [Punica granatum]|uniref:Uncharacterized protein n=1 Tax=Punica granatum TaxID=22663 RepID=A0A2I0IU45_PUNGR|nr:hypothetical protein CRG98_032737 [Punica granatum]